MLKREVIRPIVNAIFDRIKTTHILGYLSDKDTKGYVSAITGIIDNLASLGVDLDFKQMTSQQQNRLLNEIVKQTRAQVVADVSCCSCAYAASFFKPETTPQQIEDNAEIIANAVQAALRLPSRGQSLRVASESSELQGVKIKSHRV